MDPQVVITGASGYLGRNLAGCFRRAGWRVGGAGRLRQEGLDWFGKLDLENETMPEWPAADLFIHAAYDFSAFTPAEIKRRNVRQSIRILSAAQESGAKRLIFISSMAAYEKAQSWYGLGKFEVEEYCRKTRVGVVRPGLLYGAPQGGLTASLAKAVKALPLLPYPYYTQGSLYACHVADVCLACLAFASFSDSKWLEAPIIAAADQPWKFKELLEVIAAAQDFSPALVPIPWRVPWSLLRLMETLGLKPAFRSDSLISLSGSPSNLDFNGPKLGIRFRPLTPVTFTELTPADPAWTLAEGSKQDF